jgi:hypothetical protein
LQVGGDEVGIAQGLTLDLHDQGTGMVLRIDAENRAGARARPVQEPILRRRTRTGSVAQPGRALREGAS